MKSRRILVSFFHVLIYLFIQLFSNLVLSLFRSLIELFLKHLNFFFILHELTIFILCPERNGGHDCVVVCIITFDFFPRNKDEKKSPYLSVSLSLSRGMWTVLINAYEFKVRGICTCGVTCNNKNTLFVGERNVCFLIVWLDLRKSIDKMLHGKMGHELKT